MARTRILHIITQLDVGGAERIVGVFKEGPGHQPVVVFRGALGGFLEFALAHQSRQAFDFFGVLGGEELFGGDVDGGGERVCCDVLCQYGWYW